MPGNWTPLSIIEQQPQLHRLTYCLRMCVVPFIRNCRCKNSYIFISMIHLCIQSWLHPQFWAIALQCHFRRREDSSCDHLAWRCCNRAKPPKLRGELFQTQPAGHEPQNIPECSETMHLRLQGHASDQGHVRFHCYTDVVQRKGSGRWMDGWWWMHGWMDRYLTYA